MAISFLVAAGAFWLAAGTPSPGATGIGLAVLYAVIARVEFAVGEGYARPVVLAVIPMLVLLEPSVVPLLVLSASFLACLPEILRGQMKPLRVLLRIGDTWYTLGAAALLALAPDPASMAAAAVLVCGALVVQSGLDFVVSALRMWVGLGIDPRDDLRAYAWTYLVDFLLAPVGLLAAWAMDEHPAAPAALLPLAGPARAVRARAARPVVERGRPPAGHGREPRSAGVDRAPLVGSDPDRGRRWAAAQR